MAERHAREVQWNAKADPHFPTYLMPLNVYRSVLASGRVPAGWAPIKGATLKYPVRNRKLRAYLRQLLAGRWKKVIQPGTTGDVHYFEHASGQVADVKFFPKQAMP